MPSRTVGEDLEVDSGDLGFEIDLYGELSTFAQQSPEARQAEVERIVVKSPITGALRGKSPDPGQSSLDAAAVDVAPSGDDPNEGMDDVMPSGDVVDFFPNEPAAEIMFKAYATPERQEPAELESVFDAEPEDVAPVEAAPDQVVCADCGSVSNRDDLLCIGCGAFLGEFDESAPVVEAPIIEVEAAVVEPAVPTCADCGEEVTAEEVFCPGCGAVLN
jgi:hypothetical protein